MPRGIVVIKPDPWFKPFYSINAKSKDRSGNSIGNHWDRGEVWQRFLFEGYWNNPILWFEYC